MSSPRHEISVSGSSQPPDVLSETTDLETLFEAIVGRKPAGAAPSNVAEASAERIGDEVKRLPQPVPYLPPVSIDRRAGSFVPSTPEIRSVPGTGTVTEIRPVTQPPPRVDVGPEPLISTPPVTRLVAPIDDETPAVADEDDEQETDATPVGWLRVVRRSPWPVMVIVGGMALATVSAIGLRSSSSAGVEPPTVASPPATLPSGYAPQLPAAALMPVDENLAPPSTAFGDSSWRPTAPAATAPIAAPTPAPVAPAPVAAKPAAASASPARAVPATNAAVVTAPAAATPAPAPRIEEPAIEPPREPVTVVEAASPLAEPAAPASPPAVSSTRPATAVGASNVVPELPRPATTPRTMMPVVAARRLTGGMPEYSAALRQRKVGGVVDVQMRIDLNGRVVSAIAVSGPPPLRQAAEAAVLKWRYTPATRNGIPIETESKVSFSFDPSQSRRP